MYVLLAICLTLYPQVCSSHSHGSVIIFFPGGGVQRILGRSHDFHRERKGIGSQQIIRWGGGLDKIECQLTANERG